MACNTSHFSITGPSLFSITSPSMYSFHFFFAASGSVDSLSYLYSLSLSILSILWNICLHIEISGKLSIRENSTSLDFDRQIAINLPQQLIVVIVQSTLSTGVLRRFVQAMIRTRLKHKLEVEPNVKLGSHV